MTAAAVPEGNLSFSSLIMLRFIGMARMVPRAARKRVQPTSTGHDRCSPPGLSEVAESIRRAAMAETMVPPVV